MTYLSFLMDYYKLLGHFIDDHCPTTDYVTNFSFINIFLMIFAMSMTRIIVQPTNVLLCSLFSISMAANKKVLTF